MQYWKCTAVRTLGISEMAWFRGSLNQLSFQKARRGQTESGLALKMPRWFLFFIHKDEFCLVSVHSVHMGCSSLVEHRTVTPLTQVRFPGAARDFPFRVNFRCRLSYGVRTPPCAIACIYIYVDVKDPVVHDGVRWIMETLKHPAYTLGWVARLCCSWLSPEQATRTSHGRNPIGTVQKSEK